MTKQLKYNLYFFMGLIVTLTFDQWTKWLAVSHLKGNPPFVLMEGVFEFLYSENRGAAFGLLQGRQGFFFLITVVVLIGIIIIYQKIPEGKKFLPLRICLFFMTSGAIGNMIDRVTQGFVVDFLYFKLINFPIFNIADCYVTIATFLLIVLYLFYYKEEDLEFLTFKKEV